MIILHHLQKDGREKGKLEELYTKQELEEWKQQIWNWSACKKESQQKKATSMFSKHLMAGS